MNDSVNYHLRDGSALKGTTEKYSAELQAGGIPEEDIQGIGTKLDDLKTKNTAQEQAEGVLRQATARQDAVMARANAHVNKLKEAVKGAFTDKPTWKEFHIGSDKLNTVKGMYAELNYLPAVAEKYKTELAKRGFKDADIALLTTLAEELDTADVAQENAKKVAKGATEVRDLALKDMKTLTRSIRHGAKVCFSKPEDAAKLKEFEPISDGGSGGSDTPPENPPTPPQQ